MEALPHDLRSALRLIWKSPLFAATVVVTLALGIGANLAIFTLLDQVLLRDLPVRDPQQLVILSGPGPNAGWVTRTSDVLFPLSHPMYEDFRDRNEVFSGMLARFPTDLSVGYRGGTELAQGSLVSGTYFDVLGVGAALGRVLTPADDRAGTEPAAVLGHAYWTRRFGANPDVLGESISVNGHPATIVGVAAAGFHGIEIGRVADVYVPLAMKPALTPVWNGIGERRVLWLEVMGRLKPNLTVEQARPSLDGLYGQILAGEVTEPPLAGRPQSFLDRFKTKKLELLPGLHGIPDLRRQLTMPLMVLMAMVGLVVLISCANVANLLLARATTRRKEVAVRLALGAARKRIVRQLLVESLLLSLLAAALGLVIASWTTGVLLRALPLDNAAVSFRATADLRVAAFAVGLALVTTLLAGLAPALQATRPALAPSLKSQAGSLSATGEPLRLRKTLVVAQVALSAVLLVGAGLLSHSLANLHSMDPGFQKQNLLSFGLDPLSSGYSHARSLALFAGMRDRLSAVPGVRGVSMSSEPVMAESHDRSSISVEGYTPQEGEDMNPNMLGVGPSFFTTMGMPLLAGRELDERDGPDAPRVAVVNQTFARYFFHGESPIGRHFSFRGNPNAGIEIVGLVRDAKLNNVRETVPRFLYVPYAQYADLSSLVFYLRTDRGAGDLAGAVRAAARAQASDVPITNVQTMTATIDQLLFADRIVGLLAASFGALAAALAAVGLFGVLGYAVARRTKEIGVRVALGADRRRILRLVFGEVASLTGAGLAIGLPCGYGLGRLIQSRLFGLTAFDPPTLVGTGLLLGLAAALAGTLPALRASRVAPSVALRYE